MKILVTAGNTQTPIDEVRCITNIFSGRTGAQIAMEAHRRGHEVTLLTSHPDVIRKDAPAERWITKSYRTFDDLSELMAQLVPGNKFDVLIHAAAVSDFKLAGIHDSLGGRSIDTARGKISSRQSDLWLHLTPTPKLADMVRSDWGFRGPFVKFKLEVGVSDEVLKEIAFRSRAKSNADLIVANTLEGKDVEAFIGHAFGGWQRVPRSELAGLLLELVEQKQGLARGTEATQSVP